MGLSEILRYVCESESESVRESESEGDVIRAYVCMCMYNGFI